MSYISNHSQKTVTNLIHVSAFTLLIICSQLILQIESSQLSLTEDEVKQIVMEDPEIVTWLENNEFVVFNQITHNPNLRLWELTLITTNNSSYKWILAVVNEETKSVISISYSENPGIPIDKKSNLDVATKGEQALQYFLSLPISIQYTSQDFEFKSYYHNTNRYLIFGSNTSSGDQFEIEAWVGMNTDVNGDPNFHLIKIISNFNHQGSQTTIDEVELLLHENPYFTNFITDYPDFSVEIFAVEYFESPFNSYPPGFGFEVISTSDHKFEFGYKSGTFTQYGDHENNPEVSFIELPRNNIWIDYDDNNQPRAVGGFYYSVSDIVNILDLVIDNATIFSWIQEIKAFKGKIEYLSPTTLKLTIEGLLSKDIGYFFIDVSSRTILTHTIIISIPNQLTTTEVLNKVESELNLFSSTNEITNCSALYDTKGTWYINIYNPIVDQNWIEVLINDSSGDILQVNRSPNMIQPRLSIADVEDIILSTNYLIHYGTFRDSKLVYYYNENEYWTVFMFSEKFPDNYYRILIDDNSGEVFSETNNIIGIGNRTSSNVIEAKLDQIGEITNFRKLYPNSFELLYFDGDWIFYAESIESQLLLNQISVQFDQGSEQYEVSEKQRILWTELIHGQNVRYYNGYEEYLYEKRMGWKNSDSTHIITNSNNFLLNMLFTVKLSDISDIDFNSTKSYSTSLNNTSDNYRIVIVGLAFGILIIIVYIYRRIKSPNFGKGDS